MQEYLEDLQIVQKYADINRQAILAEIIKGMKWKVQDTYSCIHNYVESAGHNIYRYANHSKRCYFSKGRRKGNYSSEYAGGDHSWNRTGK